MLRILLKNSCAQASGVVEPNLTINVALTFLAGILHIGFIIAWSIGFLFFSLLFWGILEMPLLILRKDGIIKKEIEIPYLGTFL